MKLDPEEVRRKARTACENCLKTFKGEEYIEAQTALAKEQYGKLLELCPDDIEAKIYCAYYEANDPMIVYFTGKHERAAQEMMEALDVFVEDLKTASLSVEEEEALIEGIATRVMVLAKTYNQKGVAIQVHLLQIGLLIDNEHIGENIEIIEAEFVISTALIAHLIVRLLDCPSVLKSTAIRAAIMVACQEGLELLVESPGFAVADNGNSVEKCWGKLTVLLDAMKAINPSGYYYIPLPKYEWADGGNKGPFDIRKCTQENFERSQMAKKIKQYNAKVRVLERDALRKTNREKTKKYWEEHPDRPKELNDEMEKVRQTIRQNESKIEELNQQCTAAVAECDGEPIPASAEKEKLQQQCNALEAQQATLGFFQFSAKRQVKRDLAEVRAAYEQVQNNELIQERQKREKKSRVAEAYQEKIDQIEEENENLNERLDSLRKELDNPLGLDPM